MTLVARLIRGLRILAGRRNFLLFLTATGLSLIALNAWLIAPINQAVNVELAGKTMGTTWSAKYTARKSQVDQQVIDYELRQRLQQINQVMSTYIDDSELSLLNRAAVNQWHRLSTELQQIINRSLQISEQSQGYFDITVGSVVEQLGFGADSDGKTYQVGYRSLQLNGNQIYKSQPIKIDLSAIAKGYAVDELANILRQYKIDNFLLEIGGEIRLSGSNFRQQPWRIAIEQPTIAGRQVLAVLPISNVGIASSGSYRNFIKRQDKLVTHLVQPQTKQPISHANIATTVIAANTELADAWATALMVMPREQGIALANARNLAALIIEGNLFDQSKQYLFTSTAMQHILDEAGVSLSTIQATP